MRSFSGLRAHHKPDPIPLQHVRDPDEACHELGRRPFVHLDGGPDLLDLAVRHHGHSVAHGERLFLVVCHVNEGDSHLLLDPLQLELHLQAQLQVERSEWLVQQ